MSSSAAQANDTSLLSVLIDRCKDDLLDLTFRNALLNCKDGRFTLMFDDVDVGELEDRLARGRGVQLKPADQESATALKPVGLEGDAFVRRCVGVYRRSKSRIEETGIDTLYLGLGFVRHVDPQSRLQKTQTRDAPAILLPVTLSRKTTMSGFSIVARDEPARMNKTLSEWLAREHRIDIGDTDDLPTDESGLNVHAIFDKVEVALDESPSFELHRDRACLGLFEFQKVAMYEDLERIRESGDGDGGALEIVAGEGGQADPSHVPPNALDDDYPPGELLTVLPSDSYQTAAIATAHKGTSFVLRGPPGTGKSQTIANLIAHLLAEGKKVLFCAEKSAALDAVYKRLAAVGLADHCLDLHARDVNKSTVAKDILAAIEVHENGAARRDADDYPLACDRVRDCERKLNVYARKLHEPHEIDGRSPSELMAFLAGKPETEPVWSGLAELDARDRDRVEDVIRELVFAWQSKPKDLGWDAIWWKCADDNLPAACAEWADAVLKHCEALVAAHDVDAAAKANLDTSWLSFIKPSARRKKAIAEEAAEKLSALVTASQSVFGKIAPGLEECLTVARNCLADPEKLKAQGLWTNAAERASALGVIDPAGILSSPEAPSAGELVERFHEHYARVTLERWMALSPALASFASARHESVIENYRRHVTAQENLGPVWASARIAERVQLPDTGSRSRDADEKAERDRLKLLRREGAKVRRHLPPRKLFERAGDIVLQVKPCVMMSPLSIALHLPRDVKFDVLVFDESSQIKPSDALGAIHRADQVVFAGDEKQLPPTDFFSKAHADDDDDDGDDDAIADIAAMESILDMALANGMPTATLRMHYRSLHESLIHFSNHSYYDRDLVTMPSPDNQDDMGVALIDPGGIYERGIGRNEIEARAVVADAAARIKAGESVGIVTFNTKQQSLVQDLLDRMRADDEALNAAWQTAKDVPFVKNLESVQGDERDVILFSVTFAPTQDGKQGNNFGPLNRNGGERRLNVAVTRSRRAMVVYSSLDPDRIKSDRQGVRDLKEFLIFARDGADALAYVDKGSVGGTDSPFEDEVIAKLVAKGWEVAPQIGVSSFRIDIGVIHPEKPGAYLAGIECDGRMYHSSATARERDFLRQKLLEEKGWKILRIWSPDWWQDANAVIGQIDGELRSLLENGA